MGIGIIAPTENPCILNIRWEKVTQPVDSVHRPGLLAMSVQPMHGYNAVKER